MQRVVNVYQNFWVNRVWRPSCIWFLRVHIKTMRSSNWFFVNFNVIIHIHFFLQLFVYVHFFYIFLLLVGFHFLNSIFTRYWVFQTNSPLESSCCINLMNWPRLNCVEYYIRYNALPLKIGSSMVPFKLDVFFSFDSNTTWWSEQLLLSLLEHFAFFKFR